LEDDAVDRDLVELIRSMMLASQPSSDIELESLMRKKKESAEK
jgi:hypothetical protein